jgi:hypothetical protein
VTPWLALQIGFSTRALLGLFGSDKFNLAVCHSGRGS